MKKINLLAIAVITIIATNVSAQTKTSFGIRAGVNFQNINGRDINDDKLENKLRTGFNVGVNAEIPVGVDFYLQPGVLLSSKGAKEKGSNANVGISYIEVPVNFLYKPVLGEGKLLMGFGPYVGFGVGGKDISFTNSVTPPQAYSEPYRYFKRFDAGANFLFGYEMKNKLSLQLNAGLGLININPEIETIQDDRSYKNTGFGLSLGYRF